MKKLLLFAFAICLFSTSFAQDSTASRSTVRSYWNQRLVPGYVKDSTTWAAFWNMNDDGTPLVYPDSFAASVNTNDTLIIKDTAGTFKKVAASSLTSALPYKVYTATLTDTIATVLQNTLDGDITWSRGGTGSVIGYYSGSFPLYEGAFKKVFIIIGESDNSSYLQAKIEGTHDIAIAQLDLQQLNSLTLLDNTLYNTAIEIRVYP